MGREGTTIRLMFAVSDIQRFQWKAKLCTDRFASSREWIQIFMKAYLNNDEDIVRFVQKVQKEKKRLRSKDMNKIKREIKDGELLAGALDIPGFELSDEEFGELYDLEDEGWEFEFDELYDEDDFYEDLE